MERYAVVIHREPEGGFWAEVSALPGCYSQGETVDELLENAREAIAGVVEVSISIPVHGNTTLKPGIAGRIARDSGIQVEPRPIT